MNLRQFSQHAGGMQIDALSFDILRLLKWLFHYFILWTQSPGTHKTQIIPKTKVIVDTRYPGTHKKQIIQKIKIIIDTSAK